MTNFSRLYKDTILANLPAGITASNGFFIINGRKFPSFKKANWRQQYVAKFGAVADPSQPSGPQRIILVTDFAGDCDDTPAVLIACDAHARGDANLLGIVVSSSIATSAPGVYGQLAAYNMTYIPIYAYQGSIGTYNNRISAPLRNLFGIPSQTRTAYQDDVVGLRTMLAAAPDASVKMIDVGAPVSTSRLLDSPADAISPMTGRELIAAKVIGLWMMAGEFTSTRNEYNADRHPASTKNVYETWPTPIYAHGAEVGANVFTAPMLNADPVIDPVKVAFDEFLAATPGGLTSYLGRMGRHSWDPCCVDHAIYGDRGIYNLAGANGTITVDNLGVTTWSATPAGNRSYVGKATTNANVAAAVQARIDNTIVMENNDAVAPAQVTTVTVSGVGTSRLVSWVRPASGGSPITQYVVRMDGQVIATVPGNQFSYTQADLSEGTKSVTVQAVNKRGAGPQSNPVEFTVTAPVEGPTPTNVAFALQEGTGTTVQSNDLRSATVGGGTWNNTPRRLTFTGAMNNRIELQIPSTEESDFYMMGVICRMSSTSGLRQLVSRTGATTDDRYFQYRINAGIIELISFSASPNTEATILTSAAGIALTNEWAMYTALFNRGATNTQAIARKNGSQIISGTVPNQKIPTFAAPLHFGTRFGGGDAFAGDIAAASILYTGARNAGIEAFEAELRAIATAKGITIP